MRLTARLSVLVITIFVCFSAGHVANAQEQPPIQAGQVIISELRYRGPNGPMDEFIELYNNTDGPIVVQALDASAGWSIVISNGQIAGIVCRINNGITIPARGHFLCTNDDPENQGANGYSLNEYPSGSPNIIANALKTANALPPAFLPTTGNTSFLVDDMPDGYGVALFATQNGPNMNFASRLDAFGFPSSPALFREGTGFPVVPNTSNEHTLYRDQRPALPKDTNNNAADFLFVQTAPTIQSSLLGAPGPENLNSPTIRNDLTQTVLDPGVSPSAYPNRERTLTPEPNADLGSLFFRRTFTNNTGQLITRLRFRVTDITTLGVCSAPCADMRTLSSADVMITLSNQQTVLVRGVTLEQDPPIQPLGGGFNSSVSADWITLTSPIPPGQSFNIQFRLGVMRGGSFRWVGNVELQTSTGSILN